MKISLIIPCYNEEVNIQKGVLDRIGNYTRNDERFSEVIVVDDGSTDLSVRIIEDQYIKSFPKFKLIQNSHLGKAFAVIRGIKEAKNEFVMFSDIDLATPIEEAEKLISGAEEGYDIVIGSRSDARKGAPIARKIMALGMIIIKYYIIGLKGIHDSQCGFKLFNRIAARKIIDNLKVFKDKSNVSGSSVSAGFDIEFLFIATKLGYSIKEIPVTWMHVETKNVTFIKSSLESLRDIISIKWYELRGDYPRLTRKQ